MKPRILIMILILCLSFLSAVSEDFDILLKKAQKGDADSQYRLGLMYCDDEGDDDDYTEAAKWFKLAVDQNHPGAQCELSDLYFKGWGVLQNKSEALRLLELSAQQGYEEAQFELKYFRYRVDTYGNNGRSYETISELIDIETTSYVSERQYYLGMSLLQGDYLEQDYKEAFQLILRSAENNHTDAQYMIGLLYALGKGVVQNDKESYFWLLVAAANGNEKALNAKDLIASGISSKQIAAVQESANSWLINHR